MMANGTTLYAQTREDIFAKLNPVGKKKKL